MAPEYDRKLTAILHADVEGYSRLMRQDEESTVRTLSAYREAMTTLASQNKGRVIDSTGDSVLAEFFSVVDAVRCAVAIQGDIKTRNAALPEDRRLWFRIGVNLGDVIDEGDRIYGDGVNVASRVQELADKGGICITRPAYDQVKDKLSFQYDYIGEHSVKNIDEPVWVYRVITELDAGTSTQVSKKPRASKKLAISGVVILMVGAVVAGLWFNRREPMPPRLTEVASVESMTYPLPDDPSIAVLPFDNLSGNPEDEYLADGLTENIITYLSHHPKLLVVSRNSTATYKGKAVKIKDVAEELSVKYVLEGSVQKSADRIRVTIQLIDAVTGYHRLSKTYDRNLKDFFTLQDEVSMNTLEVVATSLFHPTTMGTTNIEAYRYVVQAYLHEGGSVYESMKLAERAVELDPELVSGWCLLSVYQMLLANAQRAQGLPNDEARNRSYEAIDMATSLDANSAMVIGTRGTLYSLVGDFDKAITMLRKALRINPNNVDWYRILADNLLLSGKPEEAIQPYITAMRMDPISHYRITNLEGLLLSYALSDQPEKALETYKLHEDHIKRTGTVDPFPPFLQMAALHIWYDQKDKAKTYIDKALIIDPKISLQSVRTYLYYWEPNQLERYLSALKEAGLR